MNPRDLDSILDRTLDEIRNDGMAPEAEGQAAERVWASLARDAVVHAEPTEPRHSIRDCADFQALLPAYLRGDLVDARRMLLQDHVTECVACRRALRGARDLRRQKRVDPTTAEAPSPIGRWAWRVAAAAVIFVALIGLSVKTDILTLEAGGLIHIESIDGEAFSVLDAITSPVRAGDQISFQDAKLLRTGKDSRAMVRLADGSLVEIGERAELAVRDRRPVWRRSGGDAVIDLRRGAVIVEASDQGSGHLFVDTPEAEVSVTGTVFAVNHGVKGSRVTVLEGEVRVDHDRQEDVLHPGDQATTRRTLERVPIDKEIAWSAKIEQHLALVRELTRIGREIDQEIQGPARRFDTALLDRVPPGTAIYVGIPNFTDALGQAYDRMQTKISSNALLAEWWQKSVAENGADAKIAEAIDRLRSYGRTIGEEVVVAVGNGPNHSGFEGAETPLVLVAARVVDAAQLRALASKDLAGDLGRKVALVGDPLPEVLPEAELYLWIGDEFLAVSPRIESIQEFANTAHGGGASPFYGSSFHTRLADLYANGVEWVAAADVATLRNAGTEPEGEAERSLEAAGILDLEHVIGEHKESNGTSENRAVLIFDQPRRGVASWLAEPGPIGALDFISPNAYMAAGFLMKEPVQVVDEMVEFFGEGALEGLHELEREGTINVREDIAQAIGGDFAFALDGPILPAPAWKFVLEVYDPARLQATIERIVARGDAELREHGKAGLSVEHQDRDGRTWHEIRSLDTGLSAHYVFVDGYLVASASRTLVERALAFRASGVTMTLSPTFQGLLPRDGQAHFSAVLFQNLGLDPRAAGRRAEAPGPPCGAGRRRTDRAARPDRPVRRAEPDRGVRRAEPDRAGQHERGRPVRPRAGVDPQRPELAECARIARRRGRRGAGRGGFRLGQLTQPDSSVRRGVAGWPREW